jgi:hypothetical protein
LALYFSFFFAVGVQLAQSSMQSMGSKGRIPEEMSQTLLTKKQGKMSSKDKSISRESPFKPSLFKDYAAYPKLIAYKKKISRIFFLQ